MKNDVVRKYLDNIALLVEQHLENQLKKLDIDPTDLKLILPHCHKINYPVNTPSKVPGDHAKKISDYFFEDILLLRVQREADGNHSILIVTDYNDNIKKMAKKYII